MMVLTFKFSKDLRATRTIKDLKYSKKRKKTKFLEKTKGDIPDIEHEDIRIIPLKKTEIWERDWKIHPDDEFHSPSWFK